MTKTPPEPSQLSRSVRGQAIGRRYHKNRKIGARRLHPAETARFTAQGSGNHANCGTPWSQTFSYDPFGNLSKSGTQSFQPVYSITNQYVPFAGFTATYDANGNVTADPENSYNWDAYGRPVVMNNENLTYDALGRMVEQHLGSNYDEIAYTPAGAKLALMSGLTLVKAFVALPAGAQAVYTTSAGQPSLAYYRHSDWLGSSRLASTPNHAMYSDTAIAPFGETYTQAGATDVSYTGQNQDTVAGMYDFPDREYGSVSGRWPSPDPAGLAAVDPSDPQTWNRYAYVRNSPLEGVDPTGMYESTENGWPDDDGDPTGPGPCMGDHESCYGGFDSSSSAGNGIGGTGIPCAAGDVCSGSPPPLTKEWCAQGLQMANKNQRAVDRAMQDWPIFSDAADSMGVNPAMLAAIAVRETGDLDTNEKDGTGVGVGKFQITVTPRSYFTASQANDTFQAAQYAGYLIYSNMDYLSTRYPTYTGTSLLQAAAADYNMGPINKRTGRSNFSGNPATIDQGTAGGNYGLDILLLMNCFE